MNEPLPVLRFRWSSWERLGNGKEWEFKWMQFRAEAFLVDGLAVSRGGQLDLLAIYSDEPGKGNVRRFIAACKERFVQVTFWSVHHQGLEQALQRYGFFPVSEAHRVPGGQERNDGWRWLKTMPDYKTIARIDQLVRQITNPSTNR